MLRSLKDLEQYAVTANDGDVGIVVNFLLDDQRWVIRYLVVEAGSFFHNREVLISPISFGRVDSSTRRFHVALTMDKVKNSPNVDVDKPVSRQHEQDYHGYYGYPVYWGYSEIWGMSAYPSALTAGPDELASHRAALGILTADVGRPASSESLCSAAFAFRLHAPEEVRS